MFWAKAKSYFIKGLEVLWNWSDVIIAVSASQSDGVTEWKSTWHMAHDKGLISST